jgi:hypothetical protein
MDKLGAVLNRCNEILSGMRIATDAVFAPSTDFEKGRDDFAAEIAALIVADTDGSA